MSSSRSDIGFVSFMASFEASFAPLPDPFGPLLPSPVGYSPFFSGEGPLKTSSLFYRIHILLKSAPHTTFKDGINPLPVFWV